MMTESEILGALESGLNHHQAGHLAQAEALYRRVLEQDPENPDALHLLGVAAHQQGRNEQAAELIRRAISVEPAVADYHNNLGESLGGAGRDEEAADAYRRAIELEPDRADAWYNLARALGRLGRAEESIDPYRKAVKLRPNLVEAHFNLAVTLFNAGRAKEALAPLREAVRLRDDYPEAHFMLGLVLQELGQRDEAGESYRRAVQLRPDYPDALTNLGTVLKEQGDLAGAREHFMRALSLEPDHVGALSNYGMSLAGQGWHKEAIATLRRARELAPDRAEIDNNIAISLHTTGRYEEAVELLQDAIRRKPDLAEFHANLATIFNGQGRHEESIASYRRALELDPEYDTAHSMLLQAMHYHPELPPERIFEEHRHFARLHAARLAGDSKPHENDRDPGRRLRVGYVSPDFRGKSVGYFMEPILASHAKDQVEVFCYADVPTADGMTEHFKGLADHWRAIVWQPDDRVAEWIRQDRIDILMDLSGHTGFNRMRVFMRRPAPVQATYLGYADTTGLPTMDYRLTDSYADPRGVTDGYHTEKLVRLDPCVWCYGPSPDSPEVGPLPADANGYVTFGSFNFPAKVTPRVVELWSRILLGVPGSRLLMKYNILAEEGNRQRLREQFARHGVAPERLELIGFAPDMKGHLDAYNRVDLSPDTFPYNGTTTTCEALWMGVPVVSLAGRTHVSRVGLSLLSNATLPELVARDAEEYVRIATQLGSDRSRLRQLRITMRERLRASPLLDRKQFTRRLEAAYRMMWQTYCAAPPAA